MRKSVRPTRNRASTKYYSTRQEATIAREIGGKRVAASGATAFNKGDITTDKWLIEAKTKMSESKSFSIKKEWLEKNEEERFAMNKEYSALAFNFGPDEDNYYIIDSKLFKRLKELLDEE